MKISKQKWMNEFKWVLMSTHEYFRVKMCVRMNLNEYEWVQMSLISKIEQKLVKLVFKSNEYT